MITIVFFLPVKQIYAPCVELVALYNGHCRSFQAAPIQVAN